MYASIMWNNSITFCNWQDFDFFSWVIILVGMKLCAIFRMFMAARWIEIHTHSSLLNYFSKQGCGSHYSGLWRCWRLHSERKIEDQLTRKPCFLSVSRFCSTLWSHLTNFFTQKLLVCFFLLYFCYLSFVYLNHWMWTLLLVILKLILYPTFKFSAHCQTFKSLQAYPLY